MTHRKAAGLMFILSAIVAFVGQALALMKWEGVYELSWNLISDLGVTECMPSDDNFTSRFICSPWHGWFNFGLCASGVLLVIGGVLLILAHKGKEARAGLRAGVLAIIQGVAIFMIGVVPHNVGGNLHDGAALASIVFGLGLMLAVAVGTREPALPDGQRPMINAAVHKLTWVLLAVSTVGFVAFMLVADRPGLWERMAVDVQTVWTLLLGVGLLNSKIEARPVPQRTQEAWEKRIAIMEAAKAEEKKAAQRAEKKKGEAK